MKRAIFLVIAALLLGLGYPSTHAHAASSDDIYSTPLIIAKKGTHDGPFLDDGADSGDADGVQGFKGKFREINPANSLDSKHEWSVVVWWRFLIWIR